jgi:hypothetical protein
MADPTADEVVITYLVELDGIQDAGIIDPFLCARK